MILLWYAPVRRENMVLAATTFDEVATEYSLSLSVPKTKLLCLYLLMLNWLYYNLSGGVVEVVVEHFKYLG